MVQCSGCGKREEELGGGRKMMRCAGCHTASYCDEECQRVHRAAHRAFCQQQAAVIAAEKAKPLALPPDAPDTDIDAEKVRAAAVEGDADAMMQLGLCYVYGQGGVGVDFDEAVRWYKRALEAPNPPQDLYCNFANCYLTGSGVPVNLPEAVRLLRLGAEKGDPEATYLLGMRMLHGEGTACDPAGAFKWFKKAADMGQMEAQCNVGCCLLDGVGAPADKAAGAMYLRRAAEKGDALAMNNLAGCYLDGEGVPQDQVLGLAWLTRARDAGHLPAGTALAKITSRLTSAQRAQVDARVATLPRPFTSIFPPGFGAGGAGGAAGAAVLDGPLLDREGLGLQDAESLKWMLSEVAGVDTTGVTDKAQLLDLMMKTVEQAKKDVEKSVRWSRG